MSEQLSLMTLEQCEAVIERGLATFVEVGEALLRIRDGQLYKGTHPTFEAYCRERWGWGRNYVNKQIQAAGIARQLPMGTKVPTTERQARELAPLREEPEKMAEAWRQATEQSAGRPTARDVRQAVRRREEADREVTNRALGLVMSQEERDVLDARRHYHEAVGEVAQLTALDAQLVVRGLDDTARALARHHIQSLRGWLDQLEEALDVPLKVMT